MTKGPVTPVPQYSTVKKVAAMLETCRACTLGWPLIVPVLALLYCNAVLADTPRDLVTPPKSETSSSATVESTRNTQPTKPDSPAPKLASLNEDASESAREGGSTSGRNAIRSSPVKPAGESFETPRKRAIWYGLVAAGHGSAAFDAWTTHRAVSRGYGVEANPLERPFASSGAIYATTQVSPLIMDFVGRRMMRSNHPWMRRLWWVPQTAGTSFSLGAGIHNYRMAP
jgi:hypothetical protein